MNEEEKKQFIKDFSEADIQKKLNMWFFALDQEALWDEILTVMSDTATELNLKRKTVDNVKM
ncbi:MAG: hypothetical protein R6V50_03115 [Thermoplasmatota archaeon]